MLWFWEVRTPLGRWTPQTSTERPSAVTSDGHRPKMRAISLVAPSLEKLTLNQLREVYSPDGKFFNPKETTHE